MGYCLVILLKMIEFFRGEFMSQLTREFGDICISCTVLPVLGITAVTAVIYFIIQYFI